MAKKGIIEEILSKAKFADDPQSYRIVYRDFKNLREMSLPRFIIESDNFQTIPISRIVQIKKDNTVLFEKTKTEED